MHNITKPYRIGRRPSEQGQRFPPSNQNGSDKLATGRKRLQTTADNTSKEKLLKFKETTYIGTWNVRTLHATGTLEVLLHQLEKYKWSVMGLSETRWTDSGEINKDGYKIIFSTLMEDKTVYIREELQ